MLVKPLLLLSLLVPTVEFRNIYYGHGHKNGIQTEKTIVIYSKEEFRTVWGLCFGTSSPTPVADFENGMVVGVFGGKQKEWSLIVVHSVEMRDDELVIKVKRSTWDESSKPAYPYHFIWINKIVEAKKIITEEIK